MVILKDQLVKNDFLSEIRKILNYFQEGFSLSEDELEGFDMGV